MVVEQRAGPVGQRFLGQFVQTLVGDLHRVFDEFLVVQMSGLEGETRALESPISDEGAEWWEKWVMAATGLMYLAILTAFGTDLVARAVLAG